MSGVLKDRGSLLFSLVRGDEAVWSGLAGTSPAKECHNNGLMIEILPVTSPGTITTHAGAILPPSPSGGHLRYHIIGATRLENKIPSVMKILGVTLNTGCGFMW